MDLIRIFIGGLNLFILLCCCCCDKKKDFVGCINDVRFNGCLLLYYNKISDIGIVWFIGMVNLFFSDNFVVYVMIRIGLFFICVKVRFFLM